MDKKAEQVLVSNGNLKSRLGSEILDKTIKYQNLNKSLDKEGNCFYEIVFQKNRCNYFTFWKVLITKPVLIRGRFNEMTECSPNMEPKKYKTETF